MKETVPRVFNQRGMARRLRAMRRNPAGGKNTPEPGAPTQSPRRIRLIRVKDERAAG